MIFIQPFLEDLMRLFGIKRLILWKKSSQISSKSFTILKKMDLDSEIHDSFPVHPKTGQKHCTDVVPHTWAAYGQCCPNLPLFTSKHIFLAWCTVASFLLYWVFSAGIAWSPVPEYKRHLQLSAVQNTTPFSVKSHRDHYWAWKASPIGYRESSGTIKDLSKVHDFWEVYENLDSLRWVTPKLTLHSLICL